MNKMENQQFIVKKGLVNIIRQNLTHYNNHKHLLPNDLSGTIKYHYRCAKKNHLFSNTLEFADAADLSDLTIRRYMKDREPTNLIVVLKIGLALRLSTPYLLDLLDKYDCYKKAINEHNILFDTIIYYYAQKRKSLEEVYDILKKDNCEVFLQMTNKWLIYTNK